MAEEKRRLNRGGSVSRPNRIENLRKPRGEKAGPESIDLVLKRLMKKYRVSQRLDKEEVYEKWKEVVGEAVAEQTRVVDLNSGVLLVEVGSASLLQELSMFYKDAILQSLHQFQHFDLIREIRFRAGSFHG